VAPVGDTRRVTYMKGSDDPPVGKGKKSRSGDRVTLMPPSVQTHCGVLSPASPRSPHDAHPHLDFGVHATACACPARYRMAGTSVAGDSPLNQRGGDLESCGRDPSSESFPRCISSSYDCCLTLSGLAHAPMS